VYGVIRGITSIEWIGLATATVFLAYAKLWIGAIILETLLSLNPLFAAGFIWVKYLYSYLWWLPNDSMNPTPGLEWWSFNRALPALIG
jgi:hypothetical protein